MSATPKCCFCGAAIMPALDYRRVSGFERSRKAGGTNALALREPSNEWACSGCVRRETKDRVNANQGGLF